MSSTVIDEVKALAASVDRVLAPLALAGLRGVGDSDLVGLLTVGGRLLRRVEGLLIDAIDQAADRSVTGVVDDRLTTRYGCRNLSELVQNTTRVSASTAARFERAARTVHRDTSLHGELLPARFPAIDEALRDGVVGIDSVLAVAGSLDDIDRRVGREAVLAADEALALTARGEGPDAAPPACADTLRLHATAWAVALDQDGAEPRERESLRNRGVTLGRVRNGVTPIHGGLLPEVAAQLQRIIDCQALPHGDGDTGGVRFRPVDENGEDLPLDDRTPAQRRHDALATALFAAAASGTLPTIGGAAPTLVLMATDGEVQSGRGYAHADGCEDPLPIGAAHRVACTGVIQRVTLGSDGRILRIGTEERVFNRHPRRAIALRDGGCIIPGCGVPAAWTEIHHVTEHAHGGPTHPDNGVLLCFFHHRFLDRHGWRIRMNQGVPEVQAPGWNDPTLRWRRTTTSRARLARSLVRRT